MTLRDDIWHAFDEEKWEWSIDPMWRVGYFINIYKGLIQVGPDGGPYMCFGTQKRAIRKAERLVRHRVRADERQARLSLRSGGGKNETH